ncbi:hypothetical protein BN1708_018490, partial [Verticillium longisporum]
VSPRLRGQGLHLPVARPGDRHSVQ